MNQPELLHWYKAARDWVLVMRRGRVEMLSLFGSYDSLESYVTRNYGRRAWEELKEKTKAG